MRQLSTVFDELVLQHVARAAPHPPKRWCRRDVLEVNPKAGEAERPHTGDFKALLQIACNVDGVFTHPLLHVSESCMSKS
eukprot:12356346-Alexandrium_andersonii.AAC.1